MTSQDLNKYKLPKSPGVYFFKNGKEILYIGRATSLKDRVGSYFLKDLISTRGPFVVDMVFKSNKIDFIKTDSVLEAVVLEANLIKKYLPKYNVKEKDNKSFNYLIITKEQYPRVLVVRGRNIDLGKLDFKVWKKFGPYPQGKILIDVLKILRKIFPFRDKCSPNQEKPCFNYQIGYCPGTCIGKISEKDYKANLRNLIRFLEKSKGSVIDNLEREMKTLAKKQKFESAGELKRKIFALKHINEASLLYRDIIPEYSDSIFRVEAYDVAHFAGANVVGVMVAVENSQTKKEDYRKFKIRNIFGGTINDTANLKEILIRRFKHSEWKYPNIIVVDGGTAQINVAKEIINKEKVEAEVVSVVKNDKHKAKDILGNKSIIVKYKKEILLANSEAHRFAISYNRKLMRRLV